MSSLYAFMLVPQIIYTKRLDPELVLALDLLAFAPSARLSSITRHFFDPAVFAGRATLGLRTLATRVGSCRG